MIHRHICIWSSAYYNSSPAYVVKQFNRRWLYARFEDGAILCEFWFPAACYVHVWCVRSWRLLVCTYMYAHVHVYTSTCKNICTYFLHIRWSLDVNAHSIPNRFLLLKPSIPPYSCRGLQQATIQTDGDHEWYCLLCKVHTIEGRVKSERYRHLCI